MRPRSSCNDAGFLRRDDGTLFGVCLGWSHSGEHYFGIDGMRQTLCVGTDCVVARIGKELAFFRRGKYAYLMFNDVFAWAPNRPYRKNNLDDMLELTWQSKDTFRAAWCPSWFGIRTEGSKELKQIYSALVARDAVLYFALKQLDPFRCHGPTMLIRSRLSSEEYAQVCTEGIPPPKP